jgi:hypothetical protein
MDYNIHSMKNSSDVTKKKWQVWQALNQCLNRQIKLSRSFVLQFSGQKKESGCIGHINV